MFHSSAVDTHRPLPRTPSLGAVVSTRPKTKNKNDSDFLLFDTEYKVVVNLEHTFLCQIPKKMVPHIDVLTPTLARAQRVLCERNRSLVVLKNIYLTRLHTGSQKQEYSIHKQSLPTPSTIARYSASHHQIETSISATTTIS